MRKPAHNIFFSSASSLSQDCLFTVFFFCRVGKTSLMNQYSLLVLYFLGYENPIFWLVRSCKGSYFGCDLSNCQSD